MCHLCDSYEQNVSISSPHLYPYISNHPKLHASNTAQQPRLHSRRDSHDPVMGVRDHAHKYEQSLPRSHRRHLEKRIPSGRSAKCAHAMHFPAGVRGLYGHHDIEEPADTDTRHPQRKAPQRRRLISLILEKLGLRDAGTPTAEALKEVERQEEKQPFHQDSHKKRPRDGSKSRNASRQKETEKAERSQRAESLDLGTVEDGGDADERRHGLRRMLEEIVTAVGGEMIDEALKRNGFERLDTSPHRAQLQSQSTRHRNLQSVHRDRERHDFEDEDENDDVGDQVLL